MVRRNEPRALGEHSGLETTPLKWRTYRPRRIVCKGTYVPERGRCVDEHAWRRDDEVPSTTLYAHL